MAQKKKTTVAVVSQKQIAAQIYDLWVETELAKEARAGQFVAVYPQNAATLLPRPISICEVDRDRSRLRLVYRVAGKGTAEFSACSAGEKLEVLGVLGNGFPVEKAVGRKVLLMGGGIGIPPMLQLARELEAEKHILLGYRDQDLFLQEDLGQYGQVYIATDDGSVGVQGNVMDISRVNALEADMIMACGPMPMLRAIKKYAAEQGITLQIEAVGMSAYEDVCKSYDVILLGPQVAYKKAEIEQVSQMPLAVIAAYDYAVGNVANIMKQVEAIYPKAQ